MPTPSDRSSRRATGVIAGITASATTGALVAAGRRMGSASIPFASIAGIVYPGVAEASARPVATIVGLTAHVVMTGVWTLAYVAICRRGAARFAAAIATSVAAFAVWWLIARVSGHGLAATLALGDRVVVAIVQTVALATGMRFAFLLGKSEAVQPDT